MRSSGSHIAAVLAASALWGTTGVVAHHAPAGSDQMLIGLSTFGFGGLLLAALRPGRTLRCLSDRRALPVLAVGALGVLGYASLYYWSMDLIGVAVGNALALASGPVWAGVLEIVVDRRPPGRTWLVTVLLPVVGICLLASSGGSAHGGQIQGGHPGLGAILGLGAGLGYALYSWASARLIADPAPDSPASRDSGTVMAAMFALASLILVPWFLIAGPGPLAAPRGVVVLSYLAVVPMALAYLLFGYGLRLLAASTATTLALAEPVVATVLASLLLGERLSAIGWAGLSLVAVGIVLSALAEGAAARRARA